MRESLPRNIHKLKAYQCGDEVFWSRKECLPIIWGVGKFRLFLAGEKFTLQTDNKLLTFFVRLVTETIEYLGGVYPYQGYNFVVKDIAGKENIMDDYLIDIIVRGIKYFVV